MTPEERRSFCRIVGTLLVSDMNLHDAEVRYLHDLYRRLGLTEAERSTIQSEININDDVKALAEALSEETRAELLEELHAAAWSDGVLKRSEANIIVAIENLLR